MEKQKKTEEDAAQKQKERGKRETTEKTIKPKKKGAIPLIPERKKYEMLCRGEGIRMVRKRKRCAKTQLLTYQVHCSFKSVVP